MTNYRRGRAFEYQVRDHLRERGFVVVRSAGSHTPADLVALGDLAPWIVQVKRDGRLSATERDAVLTMAKQARAWPILARYRPELPHVQIVLLGVTADADLPLPYWRCLPRNSRERR